MDKYTRKTKEWLDNQFRQSDERGVYIPHQPIYGFRHHRGKQDIIGMYHTTYQRMKALSGLNFDTLLDVGGAEGYAASMAKQLFGVKVISSDLSEEVCKRAEEIFGIKSIPADIHHLPFKDNEFDVVLCSETLEHVTDWHKATDELLRVASKAAIITVPHDPKELIDRHVKEKVPHGHIHYFDLESFNYLKADGYHVLSVKMRSPLLRKPVVLIEAVPFKVPSGKHRKKGGHPKMLLDIYNAAIPTLRRVFGKRTVVFLIRLDDFICRFTSSYGGMLFVITKDKQCWRKEKIQGVTVGQIIDFSVSYC